MKQLFQDLKSGEVLLAELPQPICGAGQVLIQTTTSLISLGTERMLLEFGQGSWLEKARSQPEKVQQVLQKVKTDGLLPTLRAVQSKLDQPLPLGYCNVGVVLEVGSLIRDLKPGDRVVSNGPHAEIVCVPRHLVAAVPETVADDAAAFTVIGAIGLQGVRLIQPTLGETVVVMGLGLIGLMSVQILRANGCEVIGFDIDPAKVRQAETYGARAWAIQEGLDPVRLVQDLTRDQGADAVLITASTKSHDLVAQSAKMCRARGRVVLVGVVGLNLNRSDFYEKEITFQVSCSYGPGRYDPLYEQKGMDYPIGFVRWTEQRNFEAILRLMADQKLQMAPLITKKINFTEAPQQYSEVLKDADNLGVLLQYQAKTSTMSSTYTLQPTSSSAAVTVGVLGAGQFGGAVLLPALKKSGARLKYLASQSGALSRFQADKFGFEKVTSDYNEVLADPEVQLVVITTRHSSHASLALRALQAGKNVFVEKPLALRHEELRALREFYSRNPRSQTLMVGFNRRFSPLSRELKNALGRVADKKAFVMTVNAGAIPEKHWTQDLEVGGGRLLGEGCHFIDLLRFLSGSKIVHSHSSFARNTCRDTFSLQLEFANGDIGTVHYFANGHKGFAKERLEVFAGGEIFILDNFMRLSSVGGSLRNKKWLTQDKGHEAEIQVLLDYLQKPQAAPPIPLEEIFEVSECAIQLAQPPKLVTPKQLSSENSIFI